MSSSAGPLALSRSLLQARKHAEMQARGSQHAGVRRPHLPYPINSLALETFRQDRQRSSLFYQQLSAGSLPAGSTKLSPGCLIPKRKWLPLARRFLDNKPW